MRKKTTNITINHEYKADLAPLSIFLDKSKKNKISKMIN